MKKLFYILRLLFSKDQEIKTSSSNQESNQERITPLYNGPHVYEDFSDPEEEIVIDPNVVLFENVPTCKNVYELINLIQNLKLYRPINKVVFHCTATNQNATVRAIQRYWKETLGWSNPGYHIIVLPDGSWTLLQDFNKTTNGVKGHNHDSLHFSYIGGIDSNGRPVDNRTKEQNKIFENIYILIKNKIPNVKFYGHNEFSNKACPSFDVQRWIENL